MEHFASECLKALLRGVRERGLVLFWLHASHFVHLSDESETFLAILGVWIKLCERFCHPFGQIFAAGELFFHGRDLGSVGLSFVLAFVNDWMVRRLLEVATDINQNIIGVVSDACFSIDDVFSLILHLGQLN